MLDREDVRPDGQNVRRLRRERGWSPRHLVDAIAEANHRATGLPSTITPNELMGIEERDERVPYETLCLVSAALGCDPIELLRAEEGEEAEDAPPEKAAQRD